MTDDKENKFSDAEWDRMEEWVDKRFNEPDDYTLARMTEACLFLAKIYNTSIIPAKLKKLEGVVYQRNQN